MADLATRIAIAQAFLAVESDNLHRYHGGCPVGFLAAIAEHESGGNFNSPGDARLGEIGYFQVAKDTGPRFGVDPSVRTTPEGNIFLACLEINADAARIKDAYTSYIPGASVDQWKFARLIFAIGYGGTTGLLNKAISQGAITYSHPYDDFVAWAIAGGASGTQLNRILDIQNQWFIGQSVEYGAPGVPQTIPAYVDYSAPANLSDPTTSFVIITAGLIAAMLIIDRI